MAIDYSEYGKVQVENDKEKKDKKKKSKNGYDTEVLKKRMKRNNEEAGDY